MARACPPRYCLARTHTFAHTRRLAGPAAAQVEFPDGRQTLVLMPAKFNKKLWVKRGGFVMVEDSAQAEGDTKVTGTIVSVLYDDQIKQLQKMEGVWWVVCWMLHRVVLLMCTQVYAQVLFGRLQPGQRGMG